LAAARALIRNTKLEAKEVALEAMKIAAEICVFTNDEFVIEEIG
jgi:ATP-dependent HslUV protease subunit HslV